MNSVIACPIKINLTLRILNRRCDGYHELVSAFWRKNGAERLIISALSGKDTKDQLEVKGSRISGENLLTKTMRMARKCNCNIPPIRMVLDKSYPAGSGIGAGSGDAAALVCYLRKRYGAFDKPEDIAALGADVAFLASGYETALAEGIGERLSETGGMKGLLWVLAFPKWTSATSEAYAALDNRRAERPACVMSADECRLEAADIAARLARRERTGLLPNDFLTVAVFARGEYAQAFDAASDAAIAWGLCGSGSAFFAVCCDMESAKRTERVFSRYNWVIKTAIME